MISEMNVNDLPTIGPTLGFSDRLDTRRSMCYACSTTVTNGNSGNGLTNNHPFGTGEHLDSGSTPVHYIHLLILCIP